MLARLAAIKYWGSWLFSCEDQVMCASKGRRSSLFNAAKLFKVSVGFWLHVTDTKCSEKSDNVSAACCSEKAAETLLGRKNSNEISSCCPSKT